jgi:hypothetical protein
VARQHAAEDRKIAKIAKAEELAAVRELKKLQRDAATAQKSHDTSNTPKRKALHKAGNNTAKRRRVSRRGNGAVPAPAHHPKKSTRGRQIKTRTVAEVFSSEPLGQCARAAVLLRCRRP